MDTETLKISLIQKILSLHDNKVLEKINNLISSENIVGYEIDGSPILQSDFVKEMEEMDYEIENGTFESFTSEEVRNFVLGK